MEMRDDILLPKLQEFITYLAELAGEGETFLLVRQKPTTGFYNDGTLRATWPAFLPKDVRKIQDDWAVYGNTGSFLKDRLTDRVSASSANCEHVLCMVLDDIGTKSKEPPLPPTWVMETSEGNYQWGYVFSEQPRRGAFAAAIRAIAEAGFTDPGACNPVRNFRLPGSVNLKTGKNGFRSRLVEFHEEREFKLEEICEALGVTPGEDEGDGFRSLKIKRQDDDVLNWLSDRGLLLSPPNSEGWCQIVCPNHAGHSDPNDVMAKYNTNDRGFVCFHEHCQHLTSQAFLDWVAAEGGPEVEHGADIDVVVAGLAKALEKLPEGDGSAEAHAKELQQQQARRDEQSRISEEIRRRYRFIENGSEGFIFDLDTRKVRRNKEFTNSYSTFQSVSAKKVTAAGKKKLINAFEFLLEQPVDRLQGVTYLPGEDRIIQKPGTTQRYGNKWQDRRPSIDPEVMAQSSDDEVRPWLDLLERIIPERDEREYFCDVLATKLISPGVKINTAILIGGTPGCGKDTLLLPFLYAIGGVDRRGESLPDSARAKVDTSALSRQWGYHLEREVLLINELYEPDDKGKKKVANALKDVIASGGGEELVIERKGEAPYYAPNKLLVIATTNYIQPIGVERGDRRWFFVWSYAEALHPSKSAELYEWYRGGGVDKVAAWLYQRDTSKFNPKAAPPMTSAKTHLIERAMTRGESLVVEAMNDPNGPFKEGFIAGPWGKFCTQIETAYGSGIESVRPMDLHQQLTNNGWVKLDKRLGSRKNQNKLEFYLSPAVYRAYKSREITASELRDQAEDGVKPSPFSQLQKRS